jgi:hypothetical protein
MMTIELDCQCIGKPGRFQALKKIFDYIASIEEVSLLREPRLLSSSDRNFHVRRDFWHQV